MNSYTIIEIAATNPFREPGSWHYWRTRWIEDGEQIDADMQMEDLHGIAADIKRYMKTGETVVWRYYETGI